MLSENLNRLHLPATHFVISSKNITSLLGMLLLLETHAEKGIGQIWRHIGDANLAGNN